MSQFPSLPLFVDAITNDCQHLSDAEFGRYTRILMILWTSPECRMPNDHAWIARKMRRSLEEFQNEILPLLNEFCQSTGNYIFQKRLLKEWEYCKKKTRTATDAANHRWNKEKDTCERNANAYASPKKSVSNKPMENNDKDVCDSIPSRERVYAHTRSRQRARPITDNDKKLNNNEIKPCERNAPRPILLEDNTNVSSSSGGEISEKFDEKNEKEKPIKFPFDEIPEFWLMEALQEKGWPENIAMDVFEVFREHWQNGKGKTTKRTIKGWLATWRTWYRKENIRPPTQSGYKQSPNETFEQQIARLGGKPS